MSFLNPLSGLVPDPIKQGLGTVENAVNNAISTGSQVIGEAPGVLGQDVASWTPGPVRAGIETVLGRLGLAQAAPDLESALRFQDFKEHPTGPFPSMASLQSKFPKAGLPHRMMGTTIDYNLMYPPDDGKPHPTPDELMAKVAGLGMNTVRLGAYMDYMEKTPNGKPDFTRLDEFLSAAQKYHVHVVLTVGAKAP